MKFDFVTLAVDGSLANPIVVAAVAIWAAVLVVVTSVTMSWWLRRGVAGPFSRSGRVMVAASLGAFYALTPACQVIIGNMFYGASFGTSEAVVSVCFLGGPPVTPSWSAGLAAGALVWLVRGRRLRAVPGHVDS